MSSKLRGCNFPFIFTQGPAHFYGKKIAQFLMYLFKTNHGFWKLEASIVYIYIGILTHAYLVAMVVQYPFLN